MTLIAIPMTMPALSLGAQAGQEREVFVRWAGEAPGCLDEIVTPDAGGLQASSWASWMERKRECEGY
jgi:hypothetical protein